jgi:hypothetical protein
MAEFVPELEAILNCRLPVLGEEGKNRINIFNSTFGPADKTSTIFAERYIEGMLKWDDRFYDYDIYELKAAIKRFANGVMYIRHDYTELGYDQEWYDNTTKNMSNKNTKREILLIRA